MGEPVDRLPQLITYYEQALDVNVEWAKLPAGTAGIYIHKSRLILLDLDLDSRPRHAVSVLAHEAAHAMRGDDGPQPASIEALCDRIAARTLICPALYRDAERLHGGDSHLIALDLGVTVRLVRAYQDSLARAA